MASAPKRPLWIRLLLSFGAGTASALVVALGITVVDLYLTGHGVAAINEPLVNWSAGGIHLSLADILFLVAAALAAAITWRSTGSHRDT